MKDTASVSRRSVLQGSVLLSSFLLTGFSKLVIPDAGSHPLASLLGDHETAKRLGRLYLKITGDLPNCDLLEKELFKGKTEKQQEYLYSSKKRFREFISQKSRTDFENGKVFDLGGIYLSRTELQVCALVAYSQGASL